MISLFQIEAYMYVHKLVAVRTLVYLTIGNFPFQIEAYTYVHKLVAVRTLVYLTIGDYLTAERECRKGLTSYPGFGDSEEAVITEQLLEVKVDVGEGCVGGLGW